MPFKGCLSDACVLMKIERFVLKPLRKIERFVLKQHTFRFADYTCISTSVPLVSFSDFRIVAAGYFCFKKFRIGVATFSAGVFCFCRLLLHAANSVRLHKYNSKTDNLVFMTCCFFIVTIRGEFPIELCLERNNSFVFMVVRHDNNMPFLFFSFFSCYVFVSLSS